jgi:RNA polymerase sigma-70 factor (ECF subfamily)
MPTLPETRASLILRLPNRGDAAAWDEFAAVYAPVVYRLARRRGLQPADADDLVQEVLAAVARSVETWLAREGRGGFRAWLLTIARNTTINFLTRARHRPLGTGDSDVARRLSQLDDDRPPWGDNEASEFDLEYRREVFRWAAEQIRAAVTPVTWQAFWQTTVAGQPVAAAARELSMSVGSVYIARSRVMARLRAAVRRFEEERA